MDGRKSSLFRAACGGLMDLYFLAHGAVMALYCCILRVGEGLNKKKMLLCAILFVFLTKSAPHLSSF